MASEVRPRADIKAYVATVEKGHYLVAVVPGDGYIYWRCIRGSDVQVVNPIRAVDVYAFAGYREGTINVLRGCGGTYYVWLGDEYEVNYIPEGGEITGKMAQIYRAVEDVVNAKQASQ